MNFDWLDSNAARIGLGLLARPDERLGPALAGAFGDANETRLAQMELERKVREEQLAEQQRRATEAWKRQTGLPSGMPDAVVKEYMKSQMNPTLKQVVGPGGQPMWMPTSEAAYRQAYTSPLVVNKVGNELRDFNDELALQTYRDQSEMLRGSALNAQSEIDDSDYGLMLLKAGETGAWQPLVADAAKYLGTSPKLVETAELWNKFSTDRALAKLQAFKGPTTDFEYKVAKSAVAQLGHTGFTNYVTLMMKKRAAIRDRMKHQAYPVWFQKHRLTSPSFDEWFEENANPYPMNSVSLESLAKEYEQLTGRESGLLQDKRSQEAEAAVRRTKERGYVD